MDKPSSGDRTWSADYTVTRNIINARQPKLALDFPQDSLSQVMRSLAVDDPETTIFVQQDGSSYTRKQVYDLCCKFGLAALSLGLERYDAVNIMGFNSLEWAVADLGTILFGGICAGIYTSNSAEACRHIMEHSRAKIVVANAVHLSTILEASKGLKDIKAIVLWDVDESTGNLPSHVYTFEKFLELAEGVGHSGLDDRIDAQKPEDCCSLVYTSGTTGNPKAVMISHDNVVFVVRSMQKMASIASDDILVSFLPCSHIAANLIDIKGPYIIGHTIHFADKNALKGSIVNTLQEVRPTIFVAVPRLWEKIMEKMQDIGQSSGPVVKAISSWAKSIGTAAMEAEDRGQDTPLLLPVAKLVFNPIRKRLGLDRCRYMVSSTAPVSESTVEYFRSLYMPIYDLYGNSETTGPAALNRPWECRLGTVGTAAAGLDLELRDTNSAGEGEICLRGRGVFIGYLNDPENSAKSIDSDGFYHTGDLGRLDESGFLTITGRIKEILITSGGENIAPVILERNIMDATPGVARVMVVGDKRKFLSCLIVLASETPSGPELASSALRVSRASTTVAAAREDPAWATHISNGLAKANALAVSHAARVQKYIILERDFSLETGELTETMKVKRRVVNDKFKTQIDALYEE